MKFSPRLMMKVPGKGILNRKGLPWRPDGEVSRSPTALLARSQREVRRRFDADNDAYRDAARFKLRTQKARPKRQLRPRLDTGPVHGSSP